MNERAVHLSFRGIARTVFLFKRNIARSKLAVFKENCTDFVYYAVEYFWAEINKRCRSWTPNVAHCSRKISTRYICKMPKNS